MRRIAVGALLGIALITAPLAVASPALADDATVFEVTGYAEVGSTTTAQLRASRDALTTVGVDGVTLHDDGAGIDPPSPGALALLAAAHRQHARAELLVSNYSGGDFSDPVAQRMFADPAHIAAVVAALRAEVEKDHWDGITVDLEGLNGWGAEGRTRDDDAGMTAFVTALRAALPDTRISVCLVATEGDYADLGYEIPALAAQADHLVLMAYDQHGPTWTDAGAIGGYGWTKRVLAPLLTQAPAERIQLGIAGYGYRWAHGRAQKTAGAPATTSGARAWAATHHAKPVWSATQREWHATDSHGTVQWWSDRRSYAARVALAHRLGLGGVAVWSLGQSDPLSAG
jgi:spore germination protein